MVELSNAELARRVISENVDTLSTHETYKLADLVAQHGEGLSIYVEYDYYYDDCDITIYLRRDRLETDDEYEQRIEDLKARKIKNAERAAARRATALAKRKKQEDEERKLYETLKAKFEKE